MRKNIGILGGTFDPIHNAHLLIAQEVLEQAALDEIWFMPANIPPHKQKRKIADATHRLQMVRLAVADHLFFKVTDVELSRQGASYTVDTMQHLVHQFPDYEFSFIIGGDMVALLPKWYRYEDLTKLVRFIGVARPGTTYDREKLSSIVSFIEVPVWDLSSSMIREKCQERKDLRYLVPHAVESYIKEHGLYDSL